MNTQLENQYWWSCKISDYGNMTLLYLIPDFCNDIYEYQNYKLNSKDFFRFLKNKKGIKNNKEIEKVYYNNIGSNTINRDIKNYYNRFF